MSNNVDSFQQIKFTEKQVLNLHQKLKRNVAKTTRVDRKAHFNIVKDKRVQPKF